jgi:hypothetical protein
MLPDDALRHGMLDGGKLDRVRQAYHSRVKVLTAAGMAPTAAALTAFSEAAIAVHLDLGHHDKTRCGGCDVELVGSPFGALQLFDSGRAHRRCLAQYVSSWLGKADAFLRHAGIPAVDLKTARDLIVKLLNATAQRAKL